MKQCLLIIGVILAYLSSFANGKYCINQDVEKIIKHDNYIEVAKGNEKKDDVVMYSSDDHKYDHSMKILEITKGLYQTIKSFDKYTMHTENLIILVLSLLEMVDASPVVPRITIAFVPFAI